MLQICIMLYLYPAPYHLYSCFCRCLSESKTKKLITKIINNNNKNKILLTIQRNCYLITYFNVYHKYNFLYLNLN